jgi:ketosteroid isomerase-like protein
MGGLRVEPQNNDLKGILGEIVKRAKQDATNARTSALRHGQTVEANATFRDATARMAAAGQSERSRPDSAANLYWQAADLMGRANQEVTDALAKAAAAAAAAKATPAPEPAKPPVPTLPTGQQTSTPGTSVPSAPPPALPPAAKEPPAAANPSSGRGTATPKPQDDDEALIRETLRTYQQAFAALSVEAVQRVHPSVDAGRLAGSFSNMRSLDVQIDSEKIAINGNTATVTCRVRTSATLKQGRAAPNTTNSTFILEKQGGRWIIRDRR